MRACYDQGLAGRRWRGGLQVNFDVQFVVFDFDVHWLVPLSITEDTLYLKVGPMVLVAASLRIISIWDLRKVMDRPALLVPRIRDLRAQSQLDGVRTENRNRIG